MQSLLHDVVEVRPLGSHRLFLRFSDGATGELDVAAYISFEGVFEPLKHEDFFRLVRVNPELGTIEWPNGADLDPIVLYCRATGTPLPDWAE
jgi:hypothetical protein